MKERKNKRNGISLIVLVITIIVMLILAGAIILTLSNTDIINKASEAVDKTNTSQVQTIAKTAYLEAFAKGDRAMTDLKESVIKSLKENGIDVEDYEVIVTPEGVDVKSKASWTPKWTQDGTTVTDGVQTLEVGDYVAYKANVSSYSDTNGWRVLGAENGKVVLVSTESVGKLELGLEKGNSLADAVSEEKLLKEAQNDWVTAVEQLDNVCKPFGKGIHAEYARSINVEDIDRITKIQREQNHSFIGQTVTYKWGDELYTFCKGNKFGGMIAVRKSFVWYDTEDRIWRTSTKPEQASDDNLITAVDDKDNSKKAKIVIDNKIYGFFDYIEEGSGAWYTLAGNDEQGEDFWLANRCMTYAGSGGISYTLGSMYGNGVRLISGSGKTTNYTCGVRAVVVLNSDINLSGSSEAGWNIN